MPSLDDPFDVVNLLSRVVRLNKEYLFNADLKASADALAARLRVQVEDGGVVPPPTPTPEGQLFGFSGPLLWGVGAANPEAELDRLVADGFNIVRLDVPWRNFETAQGVYDTAAFNLLDRIVNGAVTRGILPMLVYTAVPGWANGGQEWNVFPSNAWLVTNFIRAVAGRYPGKAVVHEPWNEPNQPTFWAEPNPAFYSQFMRDVGRSVHTDVPGHFVIGGAVAFNDAFTEQVLWEMNSRNEQDAIDGFSVHPYSQGFSAPPEQVVPEYESTKLCIENARAHMVTYGIGDKQLWLSEMGFKNIADQQVRADRFAAFKAMVKGYDYVHSACAYTVHDADDVGMGMLGTPSWDAWRG